AGHFPQLYDPFRFARVLRDFIETSEPTKLDFTDEDFDRLRKLLLKGSGRRAQIPRGTGPRRRRTPAAEAGR
ncbi:MAG TPA: hypothetical protein VGL78_14530, partial [Solirubrobacteraceae bacterium]